MRANLDTGQVWILPRHVVFALGEPLPREDAETLMCDLADAMAGEARIGALLSPQEQAALLDPVTYVGRAAEQTDAVIAAALAARGRPPAMTRFAVLTVAAPRNGPSRRTDPPGMLSDNSNAAGR